MKLREKIITGCNDCPFFYLNRQEDCYCSLDEKGRMLKIEKKHPYPIITPAWCPLKKQPIIVKYE